MKKKPTWITARDVRLVRQQAKAMLEGHFLSRQPTLWHEGQELNALADKLERYRGIKALKEGRA